MTIHVLIVEDDDDFIDEIQSMLGTLASDCNVNVARSRDEAFALLQEQFLDLVILDLKIPTVNASLDAEPVHGLSVFTNIRTVAPGTPIFVLTGSPAEDFIQDLLDHQQKIDIWSEDRKTGTIIFLKKYNIDKFLTILGPIASAIEALDEVEVNRGDVSLSLAEQRLIKIFAKRFQGVRCIVSGLGSGFSGAKVIRLRITNIQGVQVINAVAKLARHEDVLGEGKRYESHVARLVPEMTPRKLAILEYGACNLAGIFYSLAEGCDRSVFDIAKQDLGQCVSIIQNIERATAPWVANVPETRKSIKELRQRLLRDEAFLDVQEKFGLGWADDFENRYIQTHWACIHGDLHGCNILVSAEGKINLIDFGDAGDGPASLDPVTLELSLIFHPDGVSSDSAWPSIEQARNWGNIDIFLVNCPFPEFVRQLREWALRAAVGNRDLAASAYSYLVRQLKYGDTDKELAIALLEGVRAFYAVET